MIKKKRRYKKKVIRNCDIAVGIIVFLVLGIHFMTNFFMQYQSETLGVDIETAVKAYEMNPFVKIEMFSLKLLTLLLVVIKPGFLLLFYWLLRRRVTIKKAEPLLLETYVVLLFLTLMINFLNDFSVIAGMLAKGWIG